MRLRWQVLIIIALSAIIYLPFLNNPFIWDDEQFIVKNVHILTFDLLAIFTKNTTAGAGLVDNYYRPLTSLTFALDYQFWRLNPIGFHLTNWLLHTASAIVLLFLLRSLGISNRWSAIIALLFTIHPVQTESVIYINSRGDSLYTLFLLSGLWCFVKVLKNKSIQLRFYEQKTQIGRWWLVILSILFFLLAIFSKEIALAGLGLYFLVFFVVKIQHAATSTRHPELVSASSKQGSHHQSSRLRHFFAIFKPNAQELTTLVSITLIALSYLTLRATVLNFASIADSVDYLPNYQDSLPIRLLTFSRALFQYPLVLIAPINSHMEHNLPTVNNLLSPFPWVVLLALISLAFLAIMEWITYRSVWIAFGSLWFLGLLIPVSGIIPINGLFYEHWLYLPQVGFWLVILAVFKLTGLGQKFAKLFKNKSHASQIILIIAILLVIVLSSLSILQNYRWADPVRFYIYTLRFTDSARLRNNLAMSLAEKGRVTEAIPQYLRAIEISDQYPQTFHNLGNAYKETGDPEKAILNYEQALNLDPGFIHSFAPLLLLYLETNQPDKAQTILNKIKESNLMDENQIEKIQELIDTQSINPTKSP